jgi:hypothetical protein
MQRYFGESSRCHLSDDGDYVLADEAEKRIEELETSLRSVIDLAVRLRDDAADNSFDDFIVREARKVMIII